MMNGKKTWTIYSHKTQKVIQSSKIHLSTNINGPKKSLTIQKSQPRKFLYIYFFILTCIFRICFKKPHNTKKWRKKILRKNIRSKFILNNADFSKLLNIGWYRSLWKTGNTFR